MWQIWIILAGIFVIFEMIIPTDFLVFWLGVGALITGICSIFISNVTIQIGIFCITSILLFFCTKSFIRKFMKNSANMVTNANSIIGKNGIVLSEINPITEKGQIKVGTEVWSAKTNESTTIPKDSIVEVTAIDGVKAVVSLKTDKE